MPARSAWESSRGRFLFASLVVFLTWPGNEYSNEGLTLWYQTRVFQVPISYLFLAAGIALMWPYLATLPSLSLVDRLKAMRLWRWVVAGCATIAVAILLGILRRADELFVDWRNWGVLVVVVVVSAKYLATRNWKGWLIPDLAIGYGFVSLIPLTNWLAGGGPVLFDVRIPLFDTYDLYLAIFGMLVAVEMLLAKPPGLPRWYRTCLTVTAISTGLLVLLSFRRSLWAFAIFGMLLVAWRAIRRGELKAPTAAKLGIALVVVIAATVVALGPSAIGARLASFNPLEANPYSATNRDHMNDLLDALGVIVHEPILGLGIGETYQTNLIADWKPESFEVHSTLLQVWLKFGLLGLATFVGLHWSLYRNLVMAGNAGVMGMAGAGLALLAEQVGGLVQTWTYASLQLSTQRGVVIAALLTAGWAALSDSRLANTDRGPRRLQVARV